MTLEHFSVTALFCTVPVYGTQKIIAYGMDRTTVKKFFPESRAYQPSQSVHYASADILNQYQHSPMNEFQLFLLFFFICLFYLQSSQSYL